MPGRPLTDDENEKERLMGYDKPNYTQLPNLLLDLHLKDMKEAELKVCLAIARQTFGWHKRHDKISHSQLMALTGLSRQGVQNGLDAGLQRGVIQRKSHGQGFLYSIVVNEVDQSQELVNEVDQLDTIQEQLVNEVDQSKEVSFVATSQRSRPELVNEVDQTSQRSRHTKETNKRKKEISVASDAVATLPASTQHRGLAPANGNDQDGHNPLMEKKSNPSPPSSEKPPASQAPAKKSKPGKVVKDGHPMTQPILDAYVEVRGTNGIDYKVEGAWAKTIAMSYGDRPDLLELIKGCYKWMEEQPNGFWQRNPIRLANIHERLDLYLKQSNGTTKHVPASFNGWLLKRYGMSDPDVVSMDTGKSIATLRREYESS